MAAFVLQLEEVGWVIQWRCRAAASGDREWHTSAIFASPMDALYWFRLGDDPLVAEIRLVVVLHC